MEFAYVRIKFVFLTIVLMTTGIIRGHGTATTAAAPKANSQRQRRGFNPSYKSPGKALFNRSKTSAKKCCELSDPFYEAECGALHIKHATALLGTDFSSSTVDTNAGQAQEKKVTNHRQVFKRLPFARQANQTSEKKKQWCETQVGDREQ